MKCIAMRAAEYQKLQTGEVNMICMKPSECDMQANVVEQVIVELVLVEHVLVEQLIVEWVLVQRLIVS